MLPRFRMLRRDSFLFFALALSRCVAASAQAPLQFLPESDAYFKLNSLAQIYFQAKETREGGDPTQAEIGPSLLFYLKPWLKLKDATIFDLNEASKRPLVFSLGYRNLLAPDTPAVSRLRLDLTPRLPMRRKILITDRNRADLDWQNGQFLWRYRNKLTLQRQVTIHSYHSGPYIAAETFYQSQYHKWSTTALYAGCSLPVGKRVQFEPYYEHQNNTGKSPHQTLNQIGLILELYF